MGKKSMAGAAGNVALRTARFMHLHRLQKARSGWRKTCTKRDWYGNPDTLVAPVIWTLGVKFESVNGMWKETGLVTSPLAKPVACQERGLDPRAARVGIR